MNAIVIYKSKTGFTKQYAKWIGEELKCDVISAKEFKTDITAKYDLVIYGGWIRMGRIRGLKAIRKLPAKNLIIFAVGSTKSEAYIDTVKKNNNLYDIPCYYMVGGFHPKKMGLIYRLLVMKVIKKPVEEMDNSDMRLIRPLIFYVRALKKKNRW